MSQRKLFAKIETGESDLTPVFIVSGWDRPLQGFFLTVAKDNDTDESIYDSDFNYVSTFQELLVNFEEEVGFSLDIPQSFIDLVVSDANFSGDQPDQRISVEDSDIGM